MTRRLDAAQNDERIVAAALKELALDPNVAMEQMAAAAGVGRATLYRRFPTRGELVTALRELAHRDALAAIRGARTTDGTAAEALERVIAALLPVADRYAVLAETRTRRATDPEVAKFVLAIFRRGCRSGEFRSELSADWWLAALRAHFEQAAAAVARGTSVEEAARLCTTALLDGLHGP